MRNGTRQNLLDGRGSKNCPTLARQSLDCVVASWARHNNASDDNVVILARQILFAKDNLDKCTKGGHMTGGDQFEDGIPTEGLWIEDALLNPWYPRMNFRR